MRTNERWLLCLERRHVGGKTLALTPPQARNILARLLRDRPPAPKAIAEEVGRVPRRNEEARIYHHWHKATGEYPRRGRGRIRVRSRPRMSATPPSRPALPEGWFYPNDDSARHLHAELQRELPPGHVLAGQPVETFAWREGATDDVLFRHKGEPDHFTVIHLSWLRRTEINSKYPTVEFDGTFAGFLADATRRHGLTPPDGA